MRANQGKQVKKHEKQDQELKKPYKCGRGVMLDCRQRICAPEGLLQKRNIVERIDRIERIEKTDAIDFLDFFNFLGRVPAMRCRFAGRGVDWDAS